MKITLLAGIATASLLVLSANAQQTPTPSRENVPAAQSAPEQRAMRGHWRASKLIGVDVYNEQNEKLGDIDELIVDRNGKIAGVVIGVGGFLGLGQRDIFVSMDKLKFVDEPVRASGNTGPNRPATTGAADNARRNQADNTRNRTNDWYPDHAVLAGATKDSVKNMSEFKYD